MLVGLGIAKLKATSSVRDHGGGRGDAQEGSGIIVLGYRWNKCVPPLFSTFLMEHAFFIRDVVGV